MKMRQVLAAIALATSPLAHAADAPGGQGKLYATSWFGGVISTVDAGTRKMTGTVPVGIQNHNVALKPNQTQAWVTNNNEGTVSVIDTAAGKVIKSIPVGMGPRHTSFSPDGLEAYVTNEFDDVVSVIDPTAMRVIARVEVGKMPHFALPAGDLLFVTN